MKKITSLLLSILILFTIITANYSALAQESVIDAISMMATIEKLSANPRGIENQEIELARTFIMDKFTNYGLDITIQEFETELTGWDGNPYMAKNIIGTLKPNTAVQTNDILIIGAHYDGIRDIPAANDNASGMAVMLELARALHTVPTDTEIRFIAFDAEEPGLVGSAYYATNLGDDVGNVVGMLNFDMLAAKKEKTVKIYSVDGDENYLFNILKQDSAFTDISITNYGMGSSDHISFYPKMIPHIMFAHPPVHGEYHKPEDTIDNISPDMLAYAADAGRVISLEIMSEKTPSYQAIAKPEPSQTVYELSNNARVCHPMKKDFEFATGIKLSQILSENQDARYQAKINMFGISTPLTLTVTGSGFQGLLSEYSVNMQEAGVSFEQLYKSLTDTFGEPREQVIELDDLTLYYWNNIWGNTYRVVLNNTGNYSFHIEYYQGFEAEGYTLSDGELVRMETIYGGHSVQVLKKDGEVTIQEYNNNPSETLPVSENAKQCWEKTRLYLSEEEISKIAFIVVASDGIGGYERYISINDYLATTDLDEQIAEAEEKLKDNVSISLGAMFEGMHISIDCIDMLNPSGGCFSDKEVKKSVEIARATAFGEGCKDIPSEWAVEGVVDAIQTDILPSALQTKYQNNITREEFCILAMAMLESSKISIEKPTEIRSSFTDTNNITVLTLYNLGIIKGVSETQFSPLAEITREDAATILDRIYQLLSLPDREPANFTFADDGKISDYAKKSVYNMQSAKIMNGIGNDEFAPKDKYTREQAILTMVRIYDKVKQIKK